MNLLALVPLLFSPVQPDIIGGSDVPPQDPVAQSTVLIIGKIARATFTCSGTIIGNDLVLTAGHCLGGPGYASLTVYFSTDRDGSGPAIAVKQQERPDSYNTDHDGKPWDDIALLKLAEPIPAGYHPVPTLADAQWIQNGAQLLLAGYGMNVPVAPEDGDGGTGHLRKVEQKILQADYTKSEMLVDIHEKGSCFGDSGGPAYIETAKGLILAGVTSHLTENDRLPDEGHRKRYGCLVDMVYTNVLAQSEWIRSAAAKLILSPDAGRWRRIGSSPGDRRSARARAPRSTGSRPRGNRASCGCA